MAENTNGYLVLKDKKNNQLSLRVKRKISTERNFKINEQEMYANNKKTHTTNWFHNGNDGLTFEVSILFKKDEMNNFKQLDTWYLEMRPFKIAFDVHLSLNLPLVSKNWIIKKLSMDQENADYIECKATFSTYNPPKKITKVNNKLLNRNTKAYKWSKCKKVYPKFRSMIFTQKSNECIKTLNSIMIELGYMSKLSYKVKTGKKDKKGKAITKTVKYIPDTYTKGTAKAVRKFKREWNKRKLKPKCKNPQSLDIDKNTFKNIGNYKQLKSAKKKK
jgi:hypothetical protein